MNYVQAPLLPACPQELDFTYFHRQLENYFLIIKADADVQLPLLLNSLGRDGTDIYDGLPEPKNTYPDAVLRLKEYFGGKTSILLRRKEFLQARQSQKETITEFTCRLRRLAKDCNFGASTNELLRDIFVCGVRDDKLGEKLLTEDASTLTFELAIRKAEAFERARLERRSVGATVAAMSHKPADVKDERGANGATGPRRNDRPRGNQGVVTSHPNHPIHPRPNPSFKRECYRCGSTTHIASNSDCPARAVVCSSCGKTGHYHKMCRSSKSNIPKRVCEIHSCEDHPTVSNVQEENETSHYSVYATSFSVPEVRKDVFVNDVHMSVLCDTGAEINVMPFECMPHVKLDTTNIRINAWGNFQIPVLGSCVCTVKYGNACVSDKFYVVDISDSLPLLSYPLSKRLGIIAELANLQIDTVTPTTPSDAINKLVSDYSHVFNRDGLLKTGYEYDVTLRDDASNCRYTPTARRIPPALHDKVEQELNRMIELDVIRKVEGPLQYCSPMVVTYKRNGELRICADLRRLNQSVVREKMQIPTFDELRSKLNNPKFFTHLDMRNGFWQIPVSSDTQAVLSFSTPFGNFCYKRLCFGISSAPEIYTKVMTDLLSGISNLLIYIDDVVIATSTLEEHEKILKQVLQRLDAAGLALNRDKCHFAKQSVQFLGHVWSADGVRPSPNKIRALRDMPTPDSTPSLHSFLGLAAYLGQRTVPHYSTLCQPLWTMIKEKSMQWTPERLEAFTKLREALLEEVNLAYFDPNKSVVVQTDASGTGVGGVLLQDNKPVIFCSRLLTETERRYAQIEREFLGIVFTLKRLEKYLIGIDFELQTDHRPLISIFKKPIDCLSNRLQRWIITIQHQSFKAVHIKGTDNVLSDCFSRNALPGIPPSPEETAEYTVCGILRSYPLNLKDVASATVQDDVLKKVTSAIQDNWIGSDYKLLKPYYHIRDQLSLKVQDDGTLITKAGRVIIPYSLTKRLLASTHEGHMGNNKMKGMLRAYCYWPNMSRDIEDYVRRCTSCTTHQQRGDAAPLTPVAETEKRTWNKVALDLTGPSDTLGGRVLLTLIDLHSRFPEAVILRNGTSREIVEILTCMFSRYGYPNIVITDHGTPFVSAEFEEFLRAHDIIHHKSSLYYPRANSTVERLHFTLKNRLKKIKTSNPTTPLLLALQTVLRDIRSTPNDVTGETPFQRFFNRPMQVDLSRLSVSDNNQGPTSCSRNVRREYAKKWSISDRNYQLGDYVLVRKGDKAPFSVPGRISGRVGKYTYDVTINGDLKRYNQRNLKPCVDPPNEEALLNYDLVEDDSPVNSPTITESETTSADLPQSSTSDSLPAEAVDLTIPAPSREKRYNLRQRSVDPKLYRV